MPEPTYEELKARLAELEKQGATRRAGSLEFRVSEKGGVSGYGLGRFPVTLDCGQWTRRREASDRLRAFLEGNKSRLKRQEQSPSERAVRVPPYLWSAASRAA